jgi:hypothetical protein
MNGHQYKVRKCNVRRKASRLLIIYLFLSLSGFQLYTAKVEALECIIVRNPVSGSVTDTSDWDRICTATQSRDMKASTASPALASEQGGREKSTAELGEEYRILRNRKGHYNGGVWDDDLDRWGGRMHSVMVQLGQNLGTPGRGESDIKGLMGEPDSRRTVKGGTHLIYLWRGWHDYLYFVCRNGKVKESRWYFAYE